jgi:RHS repeat-associated protein
MPLYPRDRLQGEVRTAVVVQTPELMNYDLDGNLVRDGRWVYNWDAENRLVRVMSWGSVDRRRVDWTYDALGRRVRQVRYVWTNSTWQVVEDLKLVSDPGLFGRHIAELNGTNGAVVRSYVWGLDLSESLDGAGGVGGLLWVRLSGGPAAGVHFVTYDGNGNVWNLVWASAGTETARYEYGPFGEPLRLTGAAAGSNPFRFSTKRTEDGTGLVLYEYRAYSPTVGRWLCRDPIGEHGGFNMYGFIGNDPVNHFDVHGLAVRANLKCKDDCKTDHDCCRCMVFCEGEGCCEAAVYHIMKNRQNTKWPGDFGGEKDFCAQAKSTKFDCGPKGKLLIDGKPGGGRDRYDQCCTKTLPQGRSSDSAGKICENPGQDPTGGAQFFFTVGQTPKWMEYNVSIGNCSKVTVPGCRLDIYKCKEHTKPVPPGWKPPNP